MCSHVLMLESLEQPRVWEDSDQKEAIPLMRAWWHCRPQIPHTRHQTHTHHQTHTFSNKHTQTHPHRAQIYIHTHKTIKRKRIHIHTHSHTHRAQMNWTHTKPHTNTLKTRTHAHGSPVGNNMHGNRFRLAGVILQQRLIIATYCITSGRDRQEVQYPVLLPNLPSIPHATQHLHEQRGSDNNLLLSRFTPAQS